ncbi:hypothetical protein NFB41_03655 [Yersinia ruckeri]|uniref:DNA translocase FtsK n=1 Tax=Yersinia ruckeri TaxID=29486 RepID=UPI0022372414|nr:DNA translocase FtsK [Yersinia ruckeri]EKN4700351.1 hypothetical protein [Yersinia ruckeri]MCW6583604.1 hypothetical protein [Yersinia ruckeri]
MDCDELDPLLDEVVYYVVSKQLAGIDDVKSRFKIGYNRAYRIFDQMQELGVLSVQDLEGNYTVLVKSAKRPSVVKQMEHVEPIPSVKKSSKNTDDFIMAIIFFAVFIAIFFIFKSCSSKNEKIRNYCDDEIRAYITSKDLITRNLKSPSTAKFSSFSDTNIRAYGNCQFNINGYVDAQNSFGAMIRNNFSANVRYDDKSKTYYLEKLDM